MTLRHAWKAIAAGAFTCGLVVMTAVTARAQLSAFPVTGAEPFTITGCFLVETIDGHEMYVLRRPAVGIVDSVPVGNCAAATENEERIRLRDVHEQVHKHHLDRSQIGKWISVSGRLAKAEKDPSDVRELHVRWFRVVPIGVLGIAEDAPPYVPPSLTSPEYAPPAPAFRVEPLPVGTSGELPKTASELPLTALLGILALTAGLAVRRIVG